MTNSITLKEQLLLYRDLYLMKQRNAILFTEPISLTFHEFSIKNNWITPETKPLDKGFLMRKLVETLRENGDPDYRAHTQIRMCPETTHSKFKNVIGYTNKVLEGYTWADQSLSSYCYDSMDILGEYKNAHNLVVKRRSLYLHPEFHFTDIFTEEGRRQVLERFKTLDYDVEHYNHQRNVIHLLVGILDQGETIIEQNKTLIAQNTKILEKLDEKK